MTLYWLLCVCLFLGLLLAPRSQVWAVLTDTWLHWFGVRAPIRRAATPSRGGPPQQPDFLAGPPGRGRSGPGLER